MGVHVRGEGWGDGSGNGEVGGWRVGMCTDSQSYWGRGFGSGELDR